MKCRPAASAWKGGRGKLEGVRTTAELLASGLSAGRIRRLVRDGVLARLRPGVYASSATVTALVGNARDEKARQAGEQLLRLAATLAVTGSRAAGSHRSAALVYGLGLVGRPEAVAEITRAPGDRGSRTGDLGVRVHVAALPADHVVSYRGVLLTSVPRTVIDLARALPSAQGVAVADSALHAGLTSKSALAAVFADCARWRGLRRARDVAAFSDARSESVLESLSRVVFHQAGLRRRTCRSGSATTARSSAGWTSCGAAGVSSPTRRLTRLPQQTTCIPTGGGSGGSPPGLALPNTQRGRARRPRSSGTPSRSPRSAASAPASPGPWPPGPRPANCAATPLPGAPRAGSGRDAPPRRR